MCVEPGWRLDSLAFVAALNVRRAEVWSAATDQLRAVLPKAVAALGAELDDPGSPHPLKAAVELLKLVTPTVPGSEPTDPEAVVRQMVRGRRANAHGPLDDVLDDGKGLPPMEQHVKQV